MNNDEQYVPSEAEMRRAYWLTRMLDHHAAVDAAFDRFLAHVRRDAEAELDYWMARAYEAEGKLWKAEARITEEKHLRMKATAAATRAEERIKAVEDALSKHESILGDTLGVPVEHIRRALDGA